MFLCPVCLCVTINYLKMLVITKKDKRSPHDVVLGRTELLGWDDTIMLYSVGGVRATTTISPGHGATNTESQSCVTVYCIVYTNHNPGVNVNSKHQQYH